MTEHPEELHHTPAELAEADQIWAHASESYGALLAYMKAAPACAQCTPALDVRAYGNSICTRLVHRAGHPTDPNVLAALQTLSDLVAYALVIETIKEQASA